MTPTEDELARLAELEDLLTVGLVEQPINGSVLSWGEAALIAHRIGRHLLRVFPVADTAGPATERDAITRDRIWASGYSAGRAAASRVADTAGIDAGEKAAREFVESISGPLDLAWQEAEAALPEGYYISNVRRRHPTGRYSASATLAADISGASYSGFGGTPADALRALASRLAAALRTPKPEGEPE